MKNDMVEAMWKSQENPGISCNLIEHHHVQRTCCLHSPSPPPMFPADFHAAYYVNYDNNH